MAGRLSFTFRQLSLWPSTSISFPCGRETIHQLQSTFRAVENRSLSSINFLCGRETFRHLLSNFSAARNLPSTLVNLLAARRHSSTSVNFLCSQKTFRQIFKQPRDLLSASINFSLAREIFVNFHQLSVRPGDLPSTFRAVGKFSVNFRQLVRLGNVPSTSVNILCSCEDFRHFP